MSPEPSVRPLSHRGLRIGGLIAASVAALLVAGGITARAYQGKRLRQLTTVQAVPNVKVTHPERGSSSYAMDLPGRLEAYSRAPIYARVSGYLKDWKVDIGSKVQAGQLLAEIDTPDLDQQLAQAKADLMTAKANATLANTTAARWRVLLKTHSVSAQDVDVRDSDQVAKQAIVKATAASVERFQVMEGFKKIVAPFSGTVTARKTDVGDLINAGGTSGVELFILSDTHKLRLYMNVPQNYAARITPGTQAQLTVPEHPGQTYSASVEASAQSVDPASGSTLVQLAVNNDAGELFPGAFANVRFDLPLGSVNLRVPASALIFDHSGLRVATVGPGNRVVFKTVKVARDMGDVVEISSGLTLEDRIIDSPPDGIATGDPVRIAPEAAPSAVVAAVRPASK